MAVSLNKGGNVSLTKTAPGLSRILIGLGWDARSTDGEAFDLDASLFVLNTNGKVRSDADFVYYNNKLAVNGAIEHTGDNTSGEGDGDDESIKVDLSKIPADVTKLAVCVTIHEAQARRQNFGMVSNSFVRIVNGFESNGSEITRYDLSEDSSTETAMIFAEIYRQGAEWKFKAIGQGFAGGLGPLARNFGVNI